MRISVDLPEPEGPHTTTTSPVSTDSSIPRRTWSLPNHLLTPRELDGRRHLLADCLTTTRTSPGFTAWPGCTRTSTTVPAADALNSFSIFMASITTRVSPGPDRVARPDGNVSDLTRKRAP